MNSDVLQTLAEQLGRSAEGCLVREIDAGFAASRKYVVSFPSTTGHGRDEFFVKVLAEPRDPMEKLTLDTEAFMCQSLASLGLSDICCPAFFGYVDNPEFSVLITEFLAEASWDGPWNAKTIHAVRAAIGAVHAASISGDLGAEIKRRARFHSSEREKHVAGEIGEGERVTLATRAWDPAIQSFRNSRGKVFATGDDGSIEEIWRLASTHRSDVPASLTYCDVNLGNVGLVGNRAYLVDPAFVNIGNPAGDLIGLGVAITKELGPRDAVLRELVRKEFLVDRPALAHATQWWIATTALPTGVASDAWLDLMEGYAVTSLKVWRQLGLFRPAMQSRALGH